MRICCGIFLGFLAWAGVASPIIAMQGHGGFGNQVYQYLGLAASMRVAREANMVNLTWGCEFVFRDSAVGPSDNSRFASLRNAHEYFTWPREECSALASLSRPLDRNTTHHIDFSVQRLQQIDDGAYRVLLITTKSCMFHSKSLCFLRGISSAEYWKALTLLGSQVKLTQTGTRASKNDKIMRSLGTQFINSHTICIHVRGKIYEHHRDHRHKVSVIVDSMLLALESVRQMRNNSVPITRVSIITGMEMESAWNESLLRLSLKDRTTLGQLDVTVMRGESPAVSTNNSELHKVALPEMPNTKEVKPFDNTELVYLDLMRMFKCPWLVLAEPLGRGSFSGSAALWSGKHYCTPMPWMLCDPKMAERMQFNTSVPWSDNHLSRLVSPSSFHAH